jgi:hypothetical protein
MKEQNPFTDLFSRTFQMTCALIISISFAGCAGASQEGKNGEAIDLSGFYKKEKWEQTRDLDKPKK